MFASSSFRQKLAVDTASLVLKGLDKYITFYFSVSKNWPTAEVPPTVLSLPLSYLTEWPFTVLLYCPSNKYVSCGLNPFPSTWAELRASKQLRIPATQNVCSIVLCFGVLLCFEVPWFGPLRGSVNKDTCCLLTMVKPVCKTTPIWLFINSWN